MYWTKSMQLQTRFTIYYPKFSSVDQMCRNEFALKMATAKSCNTLEAFQQTHFTSVVCCICLQQHAIDTYGRKEVRLQVFLILVPDEGACSDSCPGHFTPGKTARVGTGKEASCGMGTILPWRRTENIFWEQNRRRQWRYRLSYTCSNSRLQNVCLYCLQQYFNALTH
jgi:hypothetical protein